MPDSEAQFTSDLLVITARGSASRESITALLTKHYPALDGRSVLWDFSQADVSAITRQDCEAVAAAAFSFLPRTTGRKVAYLVSDGAAYVKACKYLNAAVEAGLRAEYAVFTTRSAAETWLRTR